MSPNVRNKEVLCHFLTLELNVQSQGLECLIEQIMATLFFFHKMSDIINITLTKLREHFRAYKILIPSNKIIVEASFLVGYIADCLSISWGCKTLQSFLYSNSSPTKTMFIIRDLVIEIFNNDLSSMSCVQLIKNTLDLISVPAYFALIHRLKFFFF